jgi:hypothetical protein
LAAYIQGTYIDAERKADLPLGSFYQAWTVLKDNNKGVLILYKT